MLDPDVSHIGSGSALERYARMSWEVVDTLTKAAASTSAAIPRLTDFGTKRTAMHKPALEHVLDAMRQNRRMLPRLMVHSPKAVAAVLLEAMPETDVEIAGFCACVQVALLRSPATSYWLAGEIWFADEATDPSVRRLTVGQREDKREGVVIAFASRHWHDVMLLETTRDPNGAVSELRGRSAEAALPRMFARNLFTPLQ